MSPACERNAGAEIRILAQRTVVRVGKGGVFDWTQRQGASTWTQVRQGVLVPVARHVDTGANLPERLVEIHENNLLGQTATHGGRFVFHGSVGDASGSLDHKMGRGSLRWKQAPGYSAGGFGKALQRDSEDLAGWKEFHARDKRSGITGDEGRHSKTVWACPE